MIESKYPKPFLKWAGGKTRVFPHILSLVKSKNFKYYEPFLGGGSVFFGLYRLGLVKKAYLSDLNPDLISVYEVIKSDADGLIKQLGNPIFKNDKDNFLKVRSMDPKEMGKAEAAARFIYLNRTCFNGLYRVNRNNVFNVPFGKYKNPLIYDENNIRSISDALQIAKLTCIDFESAVKSTKQDDVVYFDPPYLPTSNTSNFTEYTKDGFTIDDHRRLAYLFKRLSDDGVCCIASNSTTETSLSLYENENISRLSNIRSIGGSIDSRKYVGEILINRIEKSLTH